MSINNDLAPLAEELRFFETNRAEWLKTYRGKWVLIKGSELIGTFDNYEAAYQEGVAKYGTQPFLVKQVLEDDVVDQMPAVVLGLIRAR